MSHLSLVRIFEDFKKKKSLTANNLAQAKIGSRIKLLDKQTFTCSRITLTGPHDHGPDSGKVSYLSSLGSELLGAASGQHIRVDVLRKDIECQVLSVINTQPFQGR